MGSFKRKSYGRVKPVPKVKPKAPARPKVNELTAIFRNIQKSPDWQTLDLLSEALYWWQGAMPFCQWRYKKMLPLEVAKALIEAGKNVLLGQAATDNKLKQNYFTIALVKYKRYADAVIKTPLLTPYLKKSKEVTKKTKEVNKGLAVRYDKILTLLSQCFTSCKIQLVPVAQIEDKQTGELLSRKFDHEIGTMYYSRAHCNEMKALLNKEGIFAVVIEEAYWLSRGMAFVGKTSIGIFLADPQIAFGHYIRLMKDFKNFSTTVGAPKTLVRRVKKVAKAKPLGYLAERRKKQMAEIEEPVPVDD